MICALGDDSPVLEGRDHFIAESATVIGKVQLQDQASVWFACVIRGDNDWIRIGERSNVQDGSILHTDPGIELRIGNGVTIGHKVMLHGCAIGDDSLIGIGSTILNGARIGRQCLVGAQSLVTEGKAFDDGTLILGSPARVVRALTTAEITMLKASADIYVANAERFRTSLRVMATM